MIADDKRVRIICGHYGSGKTEFAVNYAMRLAESGVSPLLADIDVINPYFRSRERAEILEEQGIRLIAGSINASAIDVPAISAGVNAVFDDRGSDAVVDLGGDQAGVSVLKSFSDHFSDTEDYDLLFIINANRPSTERIEQVVDYVKLFEKTCGIRVSGLINNTHMLKSTTIKDLIKGYELSMKVSENTGIPLLYNAGLRQLEKSLSDEIRALFFPIDLFMRDDWMS